MNENSAKATLWEPTPASILKWGAEWECNCDDTELVCVRDRLARIAVQMEVLALEAQSK